MQRLEEVRSLNKLRVYMLVESTNPEVSKEIGNFFTEALTRPIEMRTGGMNIAIMFLWSLVNRVTKQLEAMGEEVLDIEFGQGRTSIVTKGGYVVNIVIKMRHNQYVSEVEGVVEIEESPFRVEDF
ncbi:MAG: hypothetical protein ACK4M3_01265 [Pyrobaculum sp.]